MIRAFAMKPPTLAARCAALPLAANLFVRGPSPRQPAA